MDKGNSQVVQWLGLGAFTLVAWVQSLVGELRSYKLQGTAKWKKGVNQSVDLFLILQSERMREYNQDGGAWWASVYGVSQSRTRLKRLSSSSSSSILLSLVLWNQYEQVIKLWAVQKYPFLPLCMVSHWTKEMWFM